MGSPQTRTGGLPRHRLNDWLLAGCRGHHAGDPYSHAQVRPRRGKHHTAQRMALDYAVFILFVILYIL